MSNNILKKFLEEFFDFDELKKVGFYSKDISKEDYQKQADRICLFFGLETVYEYGAKEVRCHISYVKGKEPDNNFITVLPSIYD